MKQLLDTCAWIEWLVDGHLADQYASYLAHPENLVVPSLVQYELYKWVCRERDEQTADHVIALTLEGKVVPLDTSLALRAAELSARHGLAMADAIIYATSLENGITLLTCDDHFQGLPGVDYTPKGLD